MASPQSLKFNTLHESFFGHVFTITCLFVIASLDHSIILMFAKICKLARFSRPSAMHMKYYQMKPQELVMTRHSNSRKTLADFIKVKGIITLNMKMGFGSTSGLN